MALAFNLHIPAGIAGWAVFAFGALLVAYRIHGIDAPRTWIEMIERQFTYATNLRFLGGFLFLAAAAAVYLARPQGQVMSVAFYLGMSTMLLVGFCLLALQNHIRSLVVATAEASDRSIRIVSIIVTLVGLGYMLAPFFI